MKGVFLSLLVLVQAGWALTCIADDAETRFEGSQPGSWQIKSWYAFTSLYTSHFDPDPEHNNHQNLFGLELCARNRWLFGLRQFI